MHNSRKIYFIIFVLTIGLLTLFASVFLWSNTLRPNSDVITIYTANYPIEFLVEEVAGDEVAVTTVIKNDQDIDSFTYDEQLVEEVGMADYYLYMPASESPMQKEFRTELSTHSVTLVDVGQDVPYVYSDEYLATNDVDASADSTSDFEPTSQKEYEKVNNPEMFNPYVWTSPKRLKYMADNVYEFLVFVDPVNQVLYTTNYNNLIEQINYYDSLYTNGLAQYEGMYLVSNSDAVNYIAVDYGLNLANPYTMNSEDTEVITQSLVDIGAGAILYDPNDIYAGSYEMLKDEYEFAFTYSNLSTISQQEANLGENFFTFYEINLDAIISAVGA